MNSYIDNMGAQLTESLEQENLGYAVGLMCDEITASFGSFAPDHAGVPLWIPVVTWNDAGDTVDMHPMHDADSIFEAELESLPREEWSRLADAHVMYFYPKEVDGMATVFQVSKQPPYRVVDHDGKHLNTEQLSGVISDLKRYRELLAGRGRS